MAKKVLVLYYTQSGQLREVAQRFAKPIEDAGNQVEMVEYKPQRAFDFPWTSDSFFDAMPDSVLAIPAPLQKIEWKEKKYDLVVLAYQPWFLSLSIPFNSLLCDEQVKEVLRGTPVVTLIAARNMWLSSQEKLKKILQQLGTSIIGNIALVDTSPNLVSVVTILYWMLTGKRDKYLGIFPKPGIQDKEMNRVSEFGETVASFLQKGNFDSLQKELVRQKAVEVKPDLMFIEERAPRLFSIWAKFISKRSNRKLWLRVFKYYLLFALFIVAPIVLTINALLFRPVFKKSILKKQNYYLGLTN